MSVVSEISASSTIKKQEKKIVENLTKRTHFSSSEIERLLNLYRKTVVRHEGKCKYTLFIDRKSSLSPTPNPKILCFSDLDPGSDIWFLFQDASTIVQPQQANSSKERSMDRKLFRQFLHSSFNMTDDILMDRIFKYFNTNNDGDITRDEWIMGFNIFLKGAS